MRQPGHFTKAQRDAVVSGVLYGREMMVKRGRAPEVFLDAFASLGAINIPGESAPTTLKKKIGLRALALLQSAKGAVAGVALDGAAELAARREAMRAVTEAQWAAYNNSNEVILFRVEFHGRVSDEDACARFLDECRECFSPGYWLKASVAVLPACFDGSIFKPVYEHELRIDRPRVERVADADAATLDALTKALTGK